MNEAFPIILRLITRPATATSRMGASSENVSFISVACPVTVNSAAGYGSMPASRMA